MALDPDKLDWFRRNSRIGLDRHGQWRFDGNPVENPKVQKLFHRGVRIDESTGEAQLHVGTQWCFIQDLEDTAFFVDKVRIEGEQVRLQLLDGSTQPLAPDTVCQRGPIDVYCRLENGQQARFLRDALAQLGPLLSEKGDKVGVMLKGAFYPIVERD